MSSEAPARPGVIRRLASLPRDALARSSDRSASRGAPISESDVEAPMVSTPLANPIEYNATTSASAAPSLLQRIRFRKETVVPEPSAPIANDVADVPAGTSEEKSFLRRIVGWVERSPDGTTPPAAAAGGAVSTSSPGPSANKGKGVSELELDELAENAKGFVLCPGYDCGLV